MKKKTLQLANSVNQSHVRLAFLLIALASFAVLPQARATCQEGCDTSRANTFLGDNALINNTQGSLNTAVGSFTLSANTIGVANSALGNGALVANTSGGFNVATGNDALSSNTTGSQNAAIGSNALT